jgi:hypothetical protein
MLKYLTMALLVPAALTSGPALAEKKEQPAGNADYQNERICEDITLTGSRIASKRFCGTRAQWADKKLQDKQEVERIQRSPCVLTHNSPSGKPAC